MAIEVVGVFVVAFCNGGVKAVIHFIGQFDPTEAGDERDLIVHRMAPVEFAAVELGGVTAGEIRTARARKASANEVAGRHEVVVVAGTVVVEEATFDRVTAVQAVAKRDIDAGIPTEVEVAGA